MNMVGHLIMGTLWMRFTFVVSTNNVIVNRLCGDMKVGASYVNSSNKTRTIEIVTFKLQHR